MLSLPQEYREDFIASADLDNSTVRELKAEIQKYKENMSKGVTLDQEKSKVDTNKIESIKWIK